MKKTLKINWITFSKTDPVTKGIWDQTFIEDILNSLSHYQSDRVVCIFNGSTNCNNSKEINEYLSQFEKVLVIITSDENSLFDTDKLNHKDMIIYSQYPTDEKSKNVDFWLPIAYTPHIRNTLKEYGLRDKSLGWFFSGQVTHESRFELAKKLSLMKDGFLFKSKGFTQGLEKKEYGELLAKAKVVPSPSGAVKPEAFRTYEALEAGCVPIPQGKDYHLKMFDDSIFVYLEDWENVKGYIENYSQRYPKINNVAQSWWLQQKRNIRQRFIKDLGIEQENVTVLMSTSPIKSNPSTEVIEKSIQSIRNQLGPRSEIIIMADGVREEQKGFDSNYQEFLRRVLWKCNLEWENVTCIVYEEHLHQLEMTRKTLELVTTDLVAFMEHDMLFHDKEIDWHNILKLLRTDKLDVLRFYFDRQLEKLHEYLMLEMDPIEIDNVPLVRTGQWSQRPHISKTEKYKQILKDYASEKAKCMIEDAIHGKIADNFERRGKAGWNDNKIAIYTPSDDYSFAYHIDGRGEESKYEEKQVF